MARLSPCVTPIWAALALSMCLFAAPAGGAQHENPGSPTALAAEEKEACIRNLKILYDAIQAYQFDHKDLPNWLSDLFPDYLSDANVLICPVCRRTGRTEAPPLADPKLACSYLFEFSPVPIGSALPGDAKHTRREWKRRQMGLVGSAVPMVRCRHHDPMLNLGFNGTVYESPAQWELVFTNRIRPAELSMRAIFGSDALEEPTPTAVVSAPAPDPVPQRSVGTMHTIDLGSYYTSNLTEPWQGKSGDDLASLPKGQQIIGGVQFDIRGLIQLRGAAAALARFPNQVKGIPVHQRCQHLYFLHAAIQSGPVEPGEQIGSYTVHLPGDQMSLDIPIYYDRSVRDWHRSAHEAPAKGELKVAWTGQNDASKRAGTAIRLFVTAWDLSPGVQIDSLDFVSAGHNAAPFLVAISFD